MELSLSLPNAKGRFNLSSSSFDLKAFANKGRQQIIWQCCPWSTFLSMSSTKLLTVKKDGHKVLYSQKQEIPVLEARSIEEIYDALAERLLPTVETLKESENVNSKYIIGLAGPPGAGKTTIASEVVCRLNKLWFQKGSTEFDDISTVLPMDGFHLYRSQLDAMENPEEAHARRGAPWTFNPGLLLKCLHAIRNQGSVYAPSFDHGVGDPVENDIFVSLKHKVVIVEGNYLFLDDGVWKEVCSVFDEKWFVEIDIDTAMERVRKRHILTGKEPDVAKWRIEYNDRPNAELIMKSKKNADLVISIKSMGEPNPYPMPLNCVPPCSAKLKLPHQKLREEKLPRSDSVYRYVIKEHTVDVNHDSWIRTVRQRLNEVRPHLEPYGPCSIFKFPENLRRDGDDGTEYGPVVAAIGPFHDHHSQHGTMQAMRDHKWQCVRHLLSRHRDRDRASQLLDKCLAALKALDTEVRSCYAESLYHLDPPELASIMFRDGCFILHLLLKQVESASVEGGEEEPVVVVEEEKGKARLEEVELEMGKGEEEAEGRLLGMSWVWDLAVFDLLKLENQIPFFVIRTIFDTVKTPADKGLDLVDLSLRLFQGIHPNRSRASTATPATRIHHLLHLFHSSLVPCNPTSPSPTVSEWLPSATYLKRHGLKFVKKAAAESFLDVSFNDGRIEIPPLQVYDYSKSLFRNLVVFEQSLAGVGRYLTSYATLMECLIGSKEDAKLLGSEGIVVNRVGTYELVADLFERHGNLRRYASDGSYLADVFTEAKKYHESKWRRCRTQLIHNCFSSPWAGFATVVAVVLLLLVAEEVIFRRFFHRFTLNLLF